MKRAIVIVVVCECEIEITISCNGTTVGSTVCLYGKMRVQDETIFNFRRRTKVSHNTTHLIATSNTDIVEDDVHDGGAIIHIAEETLAFIGIVVAGLVDTDAADGMIVAIEGASEHITIVTDSGVVFAVFVKYIGVVGDVVAELEELAAESVTAVATGCIVVHADGEHVELGFVVDDPRVVLGAAAFPDDNVGAHGGVGGRHGEAVAGDIVVAAVVIFIGDHIACRYCAAVAQCDFGVCGVVFYVVDSDGLAALSGDVITQGEGMYAAGARTVTTVAAHVGIIIYTCGAVMVVVGNKCAVFSFVTSDGA